MKNLQKTIVSLLILCFFMFPLFGGKERQCVWDNIEKIVAVGDLHGNYEGFVKILTATELIDENLRWIGGKTHLVQTGDILDRGPNAKKIFDLIIRLEIEAEKAGGKVHILLGNHEEVNLAGFAFLYKGYVTVEQFLSFLPDKYIVKKEKKLKKILGSSPSLSQNGPNYEIERFKFWQDVLEKDISAQREYLKNFYAGYRSWLYEKNIVIKINDIVFTHGGISKKYSEMNISDINKHYTREMIILKNLKKQSSNQIKFEPMIVYDNKGPLWDRSLATTNEQDMENEVSLILKNLDANYMVIAHTVRIVSPAQMNRFKGKIWTIDTGISETYGGFLSALIIENGNFWIWENYHAK